MRHNSYNLPGYRQKQSAITKASWEKGLHDLLRKREERACKRLGCGKTFEVKPSDPKVYCSSGCAAQVNNAKRGEWPNEVKQKIGQSLRGRVYPDRQKNLIENHCENKRCGKIFLVWPYLAKKRKFCSIQCAMDVIGGKPTSPRAARGKAGIRKDISDSLYFYSRWEANIARLFTYLCIEWVYQPKTFDLKGQSYTPDFYLPEHSLYIEVKNFLWKYSKKRDEKFRKLYPDLKLKLLLKDEYLELETQYSRLIPKWEYRNSKFET